MLTSLPIILLISTALGFLSGLGIGGGSLLIIWLTLALNMDQTTARAINLMFFIPSALIVCIIRHRKGQLDWKSALPAIIAGTGSAYLVSRMIGKINTLMLQKLFGCILLTAGLREILYRERKAR